jgi:hypothetical protein
MTNPKPNLGELAFKAEDFMGIDTNPSATSVSRYGLELSQAERFAEHANRILRENLEKAVKQLCRMNAELDRIAIGEAPVWPDCSCTVGPSVCVHSKRGEE